MILQFEKFWESPANVSSSISKFLRIPVTKKMEDVIRTRILGTKLAVEDGFLIAGGLNNTG